MKPKKPRKPAEVIGWREHISLPDLGIDELPAKIDTGARTTALHAEQQTPFQRDGAHWVSFVIPASGRRKKRFIEAPIHDERDIKNTSGVPERRYVIRTTLLMGRHRWHIDVSLANREKMEFDLIVGRTALRKGRLLVDPSHSFLLGLPGPPTLKAGKPQDPKKMVRAMEGRSK